jgi:hypothetical protein
MSPNHQTVRLSAGAHATPERGVCVMELASMLAGEPFSDRPRAVSGLLASMLRGYNDGLDDHRRQQLKRYAAVSVGTATGRADEKRRRRLVLDAIAELQPRRGLRGALARRYAAAGSYTTALAVARRVRIADDHALHARMLELLDALVAVGRPPERVGDNVAEVLAAAEPPPAMNADVT